MITPRRTRLIRVPDLQGFRHAITALCHQAPQTPVVVVPTTAARRQLEQTLNRATGRCPPVSADGSRELATTLTRDELYDLLHSRLPHAPRRLGAHERTVIAQAAATAAAETVGARHEVEGLSEALPFAVRPGLVTEMFRFYEQLRRQARKVERFQELVQEELGEELGEALGGARSGDRGAERALAQTRLLAEAFREYERRVLASGGCDEHSW